MITESEKSHTSKLWSFYFINVLFKITAPRVANIQSAIEYIYPLVADFNAGPRSVKTSSSVNNMMNKRLQNERRVMDEDSDFDGSSMDDSEGDFDSEVSQD